MSSDDQAICEICGLNEASEQKLDLRLEGADLAPMQRLAYICCDCIQQLFFQGQPAESVN